ncbi:MAG: hypothetical protein ACXVFC_09335 [Gaiellaceae bacterium]
MSQTAAHKPASPLRLILPVGLALALVFTLAARSSSAPPLQLGPIVVADGIATVNGNVGGAGSGETLTVNGQPVGLDTTGSFATTVSLNGASTLDFGLTGPEGSQKVDFQVPLGTLAGSIGVIPAGALDALEQAGVSLLTPVTGGKTLTVSGGVLDQGKLSSLTLNGQDLLSQLGTDHTFTITIPGTTKTIVLKALDSGGNSETQTLKIQESVSAARAIGVRIVKIRYLKGNVARHHRLKMVVTVKDRLGRLIRGARISATSTKAGKLVRGSHATRTGAKGNATLGLRLRKAALGKRLTVLVVAKTPTAKARKRSSVRLPR